MEAGTKTNPGPELHDLLHSARQKAEAAHAVLVDRRCATRDAAVLLHLGWTRALQVQARLAGQPPRSLAETVGQRGEVAGLPEPQRINCVSLLQRLSSYQALLPEGEPPLPLTRGELWTLTRLLHRTVRHTRQRVSAVHGKEPLRAATVVRLAGVAATLALLVGGVTALAWPSKPVENGWRGAYYRGERFEGTPVVRKDAELAFFWDHGKPMPDFQEDKFTVKWETCLRVRKGGKATFSVGSDDGSRLYVDGKKVVENWGSHAVKWAQGTTELKEGSHYVLVEYQESQGPASIFVKVGWDGETPGPIPATDVIIPPEGQDPQKACATLP
ncbi:MAG: PA14 domain-containing protein [Myxococcota bacterium]